MKDTKRSANDWREDLVARTDKNGSELLMLFGAIGGFGIAAFVHPIAGIGVGAASLFQAWKKESRGGLDEEYVRESDCFAFLIRDKYELARFVRDFGQEELLSQLEAAKLRNCQFTPFMQKFFRSLKKGGKRNSPQPALMPADSNERTAMLTEAGEVASCESEAVDVDSDDVPESPFDASKLDFEDTSTSTSAGDIPIGAPLALPVLQRKQQPSANDTPQEDRPLGLVEGMVSADPPKHIAIVKITRGGGTLTTRALLYAIRQQYPAATIDIVDPKNSAWLGLENVGCVRYCLQDKGFTPNPAIRAIAEAHAEMVDRIQSRDKSRPPHYLVIDEFYILQPLIGEYAEAVEELHRLMQMGLEFRMHLVLITQSHLCGDLGMNSQERGAFRFVAVGCNGIYEKLEAMAEDQFLIPSRYRRDAAQRSLRSLVREHPNAPIALNATTGEAELMPDLRWLESFEFPSSGSSEETESELANPAPSNEFRSSSPLPELKQTSRTPELLPELANPAPSNEFASSDERPELLKSIPEPELAHLWSKLVNFDGSTTNAIKEVLQAKGERYGLGREAYDWLKAQYGGDDVPGKSE